MPPFEGLLKGKTVVVTGAGKGIGRALVVELHRLGAKVYAVSRTQSDLDGLTVECSVITPICIDVSVWDETRQVLEEDLPGKVDILVNNAAVNDVQSLLTVSEADIDRVLSTNVKAVVNVTQVCVKKMIASGVAGTVINVSSVGSIRPVANYGIYCASKAALDSLTKTMAVEFGSHGVRVIGFNPGSVQTTMTSRAELADPTEVAKLAEQFTNRFPLGVTFVPMEEIVNSVLFLASGLVKSMTGSSVVIDGGFLAT